VQFTVSIGVAVVDSPDETARDLFKRADLAAYQAKQQGRNRVVMALPRLAPALAPALPQPIIIES
jgi:diguanylate cyclase (GGDEF)-like protein